MIINFYSTLRDIVGAKSIVLEFPNGETIKHIVQELSEVYPEIRQDLLDNNNMIYGHVHIFVDGLNATLNKNNSEIIPNESILDIFHAVGGGKHLN